MRGNRIVLANLTNLERMPAAAAVLEELLVKLHVQGYRIAEMRFRFRPRQRQ